MVEVTVVHCFTPITAPLAPLLRDLAEHLAKEKVRKYLGRGPGGGPAHRVAWREEEGQGQARRAVTWVTVHAGVYLVPRGAALRPGGPPVQARLGASWSSLEEGAALPPEKKALSELRTPTWPPEMALCG